MAKIKRALCVLAALGIVASSSFSGLSAVSGNDFNAGRIIDNEVFYNKNAMSVDQIQQFLNSKVPNCDSNGEQPYAGTTRRAYSEARGEVFPLTCLKNYHENTTTKANNLQGRSIPSGAKSAAQIIWDAAQEYSINPQALIVLLQKEQGLITDDWPWVIQYRSATGYGCPDTAPCDSEYYGFYNQVNNAARQFRLYATNPGNYNHVPGQNNNIFWSPNTSCGSSSVFINNQATASLYNYTPYRPNGAALDNLYGIGDGCSSYGNRNFWRYFNDWFGSSLANKSYAHLPTSQNRIQTVQLNGELYVFYYDAFRGVIRLAKSDSEGWHFSILDGVSSGGNGRIDAALGSDIAVTTLGNSVQVFYYDKSNGNLRHAWTHDNQWSFEDLDGNSGSAGRRDSDVGTGASVINYGTDGLQLFYYDQGNGELRHAWTSASHGWRFEDLDGSTGSVSQRSGNVGATTAALNYNGNIQLFYVDVGGNNLRHAWTSASHGWRFEDLDGTHGSISGRDSATGRGPAVTLFGSSSIQLFYYDNTHSTLRHAWTSSSHGWRFEDLDGTRGSVSRTEGIIGKGPSVTTIGNSIQLFYYDHSAGNLKHAWTSSSHGWRFEEFDGSSVSAGGRNANIGINSAITPFNSGLQLFYYDQDNGYLRHAWTSASHGWRFEDLGPKTIY